MSVCPKCKQKISLFYLKQNCPHCAVNLRFYNFEENFYRDAKRAELSFAKINIFIAHLKASLIGSKLTIARLCVMLLPIVSLLVPFGTATISQPFLNAGISLSALGLYGAYEGNYLPYILAMLKSPINGNAFILLCAAVAAFALSAVAALLIFFLTVLSFTSIKKMHKVLYTTGILGAFFAIAATVLMTVFSSSAESLDLISGTATPGCIVAVMCFGAVAVINIMIEKQGLNIVYKEGDLERIEIAKKVKSGEIHIDDLPQPIIETEETEKIRLEIEKQQELYRNMGEGDVDA